MLPHKYNFSLSIVIPVFNDEEVLHALHERLSSVLMDMCPSHEIIFVDDGSADGSLRVLRQLQQIDKTIRIIKMTRNFGQPNAIAAGLDHCRNNVIAIMDSDLQDPPEYIPKLLDAMVKNKVPMAIARWGSRKDTLLKISLSRLFHFITNKITHVRLEPRIGVFRVLKAELVQSLKTLPEKSATSLSLLSWMGYSFALVDLERDARHSGKSGYTLKKMLKLSFDRIFSYTLFPIQLSTLIGFILGTSSILLAVYLVIQKLLFKSVVPGWTSLMVVTIFLFGINYIFLGIIGEYLGRIFLEAKQRPRYVIERFYEHEEIQNEQ